MELLSRLELPNLFLTNEKNGFFKDFASFPIMLSNPLRKGLLNLLLFQSFQIVLNRFATKLDQNLTKEKEGVGSNNLYSLSISA